MIIYATIEIFHQINTYNHLQWIYILLFMHLKKKKKIVIHISFFVVLFMSVITIFSLFSF